MTREVTILETKTTDCGEQVYIPAVVYENSEPFSGTFEVFDLDHCLDAKPGSNDIYITVFCSVGDTTDPDAELRLKVVHGALSVIGNVGGGVDVISRIGFSQE
jgi:hypothetical protein